MTDERNLYPEGVNNAKPQLKEALKESPMEGASRRLARFLDALEIELNRLGDRLAPVRSTRPPDCAQEGRAEREAGRSPMLESLEAAGDHVYEMTQGVKDLIESLEI